MINYFISTVAFLKALEGQWINPLTQTRFFFTCVNPKDKKGVISIKCYDSKYAVDMTFTSERAQEDNLLRIYGQQYKVTIVGNHIKSLAIYLSHEEILQLVKKK